MKKNSNEGYAIFMAVILALILSIVAVTFLVMGYNYYHSADQFYIDAKGLYVAEAGRVLALARAAGGNYTNITDQPVGDSYVDVIFTETPSGSGKYILTITAKTP